MSETTDATETMTPNETADSHADHFVEPNYDDVNTSVIAFVAGVSAIVTIIVVVAVQALYFSTMDSLERERSANQAAKAERSALTAQQQAISEYRWVDKEKGIVAIPIERAMEIVVEEVNKEAAAKTDPKPNEPKPNESANTANES